MSLPPSIADARTLLVFGGSFDPPHVAHVDLPRQVAAALNADATLYVPAGRAPHKLHLTQTDPVHRVAMLRLALADEPWAHVWTGEVDRAADGRPSYTVDTIERLREQLGPGVTMRLLLGTDQVAIFDTWHRPGRIVELAEPVVMLRRGEGENALPDPWRGRVVHVKPMAVSSTEIRRRVEMEESIVGMVHPAVGRYIGEHGLYRV